MQLSAKTLHFNEQNQKATLTLANGHPHRLIFKIKVTNTQLFHIYPGKGFIPQHQDAQVQITLKANEDASAKLLVMYAPTPHESDNFDQLWANLDKQSIKDEVVPITVNKGASKAGTIAGKSDNGSRQVTFKQTQSPVYEHELQKSKSQISDISCRQKNQRNPEVAASLINSQRMYQTVGDSQRSVSAPFSLMAQAEAENSQAHLSHLQKELRKEKYLSLNQKERLAERERKIRHYEQVSQKAVNDSFKVKQEPFQLNLCNICLLMLACLMFGYMIAGNKLGDAQV